MTSVKFTLKQARKYKGLTQDEMAKVLKMAKRTYIDYEQYKIPLRIDKAYLFAECVGFSIDDIIFLTLTYTLNVVESSIVPAFPQHSGHLNPYNPNFHRTRFK